MTADAGGKGCKALLTMAEARQLLGEADRWILYDPTFGVEEINWLVDTTRIAEGSFDQTQSYIVFCESATYASARFEGDDARELSNIFKTTMTTRTN